MKKFIALALLMLLPFIACAKDVHISPRDNDQIVDCSVGDRLCVHLWADADVTVTDDTVLKSCLPWYRGGPIQGTYRFMIMKEATQDLAMCCGRRGCVVWHIRAHSKAPPKKK